MLSEIKLDTSKREECIDITSEVNGILSNSGITEGLCSVFCMHTTAAIIINENYDLNICHDFLEALGKIIPRGKWKHDKVDGNADAHIKSSIIGAEKIIPIKSGKLFLGKWQSLMFVEFDGPREGRRIAVTILGSVD